MGGHEHQSEVFQSMRILIRMSCPWQSVKSFYKVSTQSSWDDSRRQLSDSRVIAVY